MCFPRGTSSTIILFSGSAGWEDKTNGENKASFITPPILSTRFAASTSAQFYTRLPSLDSLVAYIERGVCSSSSDPDNCRQQAEALRSADSLDINYDSISHALTVSGFWASAPEGGWTEEIAKPVRQGTDQIEVGLLGAEPAREPEEIKMGGLLGVVGNDDQLSMSTLSTLIISCDTSPMVLTR